MAATASPIPRSLRRSSRARSTAGTTATPAFSPSAAGKVPANHSFNNQPSSDCIVVDESYVILRRPTPLQRGRSGMFSGFDIIIPVLVVLVLLVIFTGIKTIPQGYNY